MEKELNKYSEFLSNFCDKARTFSKEHLAKGKEVETKGDQSLVTSLDKKLEELFRNQVSKIFPDHAVLGEEYGLSEGKTDSDYKWIIDPIDGTEAFVYGLPSYGSIIGLFKAGRPLVGVIDLPKLDTRILAQAEAGIIVNGEKIGLKKLQKEIHQGKNSRVAISRPANFSVMGDLEIFHKLSSEYQNCRIQDSSCYGYAHTCLGGFDAIVEWGVNDWDIAASEILMQESVKAFRIVKEVKEDSSYSRWGIIAGKPKLVEELEELVQT